MASLEVKSATEKLLVAKPGEDNRKYAVRAWLDSHGWDVEGEYVTRVGRIDLYVTNQRVIIETKKASRLTNGPHEPGTGSPRVGKEDETAFQQAERYVKAERMRERLYLDEKIENHEWLGAVTDGSRWWIWKWPVYGEGDDAIPVERWEGLTLNSTNIKTLASLFDRKVGKPWAPKKPKEVFDEDYKSLKELYLRNKDIASTHTMKELWMRQLRASGNAPESDADELFLLHTFLIAVSSAITASITRSDSDLGFAAWINLEDSAWHDKLIEKVNKYDWRQRSGDLLRELYMDMVEKKHRKIYGEYYTPDWLAEKMCEEVLDKEWIAQRVSEHYEGRYNGVLDPACGSGTFLLHAARRIIESKAVYDDGMDIHESSKMVAKLVNGIDIHPVAVAMSKANLTRILPVSTGTPLRIWQGDSLQIYRKDAKFRMLFEEPDVLTIYSTKKHIIKLPTKFLLSDDVRKNINRFVKTADEQKPFPPGLDTNLDEKDAETLRETHTTLAMICKEEGNSVWAWYIVNRVGPYMLMNNKVTRIVANPPWVRISHIQVKERKREMENAAKYQELWVGGRNATGFDISALFVDKCPKLYLKPNGVSGWVLPQAALNGDNWKGFREKLVSKAVKTWDLDTLPFPTQSKSCVNILSDGDPEKTQLRMKKTSRAKPHSDDSWHDVGAITDWVEAEKGFSEEQSGWFENKKPTANLGAALVPHSLVKVDTYNMINHNIAFVTKPSRRNQWKELGSRRGVVPKHWMQDVASGKTLVPYGLLGEYFKFIIPLNEKKTQFDHNYMENEYWRRADQMYAKNAGKGKTTPQTLIGNIDFNSKLSKQMKRKPRGIVYNKSGSNLCASRVSKSLIIEDQLYFVGTKTDREALFLEAILNAGALHKAFYMSRKSDRHFDTSFWFKIPIPRYNPKNKSHTDLADLARTAEKVAAKVKNPTRESVREALRENGISGEIDGVIRGLFPNHVEQKDEKEQP